MPAKTFQSHIEIKKLYIKWWRSKTSLRENCILGHNLTEKLKLWQTGNCFSPKFRLKTKMVPLKKYKWWIIEIGHPFPKKLKWRGKSQNFPLWKQWRKYQPRECMWERFCWDQFLIYVTYNPTESVMMEQRLKTIYHQMLSIMVHLVLHKISIMGYGLSTRQRWPRCKLSW